MLPPGSGCGGIFYGPCWWESPGERMEAQIRGTETL